MKVYLIATILAVATFTSVEAAPKRTIGEYAATLTPPPAPWPENRPVAPAFPPPNSNRAVPVQPAMCVRPDGTLCQASYTVERH